MTAYREALTRLASAQKSNRGAAAYSRFVNRPLGRRLAALAFVSGRTPDQVTALSALASAGGIAVIAAARPGLGAAVATTALLVVGYALDAADGQLARLRGGGSPAGELLDHFVDALKISALHLAVAASLIRFPRARGLGLLALPLTYELVATVFFFMIILAEQLRRQLGGRGREPDVTRPPLLRSLVVLPNDYGLQCLTFLLWGLHRTWLGIYAFLLVCNGVFLVAGTVRWRREMVELSRGR